MLPSTLSGTWLDLKVVEVVDANRLPPSAPVDSPLSLSAKSQRRPNILVFFNTFHALALLTSRMQRRYLEMPDSTATGDLWNPPSAESCERTFLYPTLSPLSAAASAPCSSFSCYYYYSSAAASSSSTIKRRNSPTDLMLLLSQPTASTTGKLLRKGRRGVISSEDAGW